MEHKKVDPGGDVHLPFARSRLKALRATGASYRQQTFTMDTFTIVVRIVGEQEYISISDGPPGDYLVFCGLLADQYQLKVAVGPAVAAVLPATTKFAEPVDWKNWKTGAKYRSLSYNHGLRLRYRVAVDQEFISTSSGELYLCSGGVKYATPYRVIGAGVFSEKINGVLVERFIFARKVSDFSVEFYVAKIQPSPTWTLIGTFPLTATITEGVSSFLACYFDPWFFSPDGHSAATLISDQTRNNVTNSLLIKRVMRAKFSAALNTGTGEYDFTATVTAGEMVGTRKNVSFVDRQRMVSGLYSESASGVFPNETFTQAALNYPGGVMPAYGSVVPYSTTGTGDGVAGVRTYEAIGVDYLPTGAEVIVWRKFGFTQETFSTDVALSAVNGPGTSQSYKTQTSNFTQRYFNVFYAGDKKMFGADVLQTTNFVQLSQTINGVSSITTVVYPDYNIEGMLPYCIDARDQSGIVEVFREREYGKVSGLSSTAPKYDFVISVEHYYRSAKIAEQTLYTVTNSATAFHLPLANPSVRWRWDSVRVSTYTGIPGGSMASTKLGEFVSSTNNATSFFEDLTQNDATYSPMIPLYTPVDKYTNYVFKGKVADAKNYKNIPNYATPTFKLNAVRVL